MRTPRRTPTDGSQTPPTPMRGRRAHAGPPADEGSGPEESADMALSDAPTRAGGWSLRPRTVRAKIVCLLMVPVVSLLALWAYATVTTAQDVSRLRQLQRVDSEVRAPVAAAVTALQEERTAAVGYATKPAADRASDLKKLTARTDRAVAKLRLGDDSTVADSEELPSGVAERLETFVTGAEELRSLRTAVLDRRAGWHETHERYTRTITTAFSVGGALTGIQDAEIGSDARVLLEFSRAGEALAQEDTVLVGARLAGTLDGQRLRMFTGAVDARRLLTESAVADLRGSERVAWQGLVEGGAYADVHAVENDVLAAGPGGRALGAAPEETWNAAHARVQDDMRTIEADAGSGVADRADPLRRGLLAPAGAAVLLGLVAVAASLVISVRIGRGLVIELVSLRNTALEIARRKLPHAMRKLRAGEEIDVRAEAPPGPPAEDEAGQVAEALTTVHRAALHAAVERAELASGISGVFVNLARRSQVLVHRQLSLLDTMERRSDDPNELSDLFRLDHLTTRMRRHAESLIILSGAAPGRAWRMPVSLTNVVRAAVSEVEDYARVEVRQLPETSVVGAAVADLTHLLAEIVENAAQFSPPHTRVRVTGEPVGNGYAVEVEDRGLGMGKETLAEANRRIEQSEALDLFDSDRLGLFVVSRLAARHGIKVHLRTSPYGGTTAVVLLPTPLLQAAAEERSGGRRADQEKAAERTYARVPAPTPKHDSVEALSVKAPNERPALVPPIPIEAEASSEGKRESRTPPGVTTLRLHRPEDDTVESDELPRRVRQASLAPQLREGRPDEPAEAAPHKDDERTPEAVRDRMAAYRAGWTRGGGRAPGLGVTPDPVAGSDSSEGDPA
ncbi:nitrate- and nitrite sensing domain-containing protein [Streptomyces phaeochromogenes]|uniref:histidine kinase n=1 Tax=Streptomyces phaeochromogenes TaxID=1923 RepID=A0ABZ1HPK3_STRPH|nr:nitrate- and nitrite sensing domain-containing protein [Streptomyces phaeochromogenes]WSD19533.1 nitrate- and nitrite sensing domain-containing protein [Streptomyces phaeochromogenes]